MTYLVRLEPTEFAYAGSSFIILVTVSQRAVVGGGRQRGCDVAGLAEAGCVRERCRAGISRGVGSRSAATVVEAEERS
jgi:hypothetical protein